MKYIFMGKCTKRTYMFCAKDPKVLRLLLSKNDVKTFYEHIKKNKWDVGIELINKEDVWVYIGENNKIQRPLNVGDHVEFPDGEFKIEKITAKEDGDTVCYIDKYVQSIDDELSHIHAKALKEIYDEMEESSVQNNNMGLITFFKKLLNKLHIFRGE